MSISLITTKHYNNFRLLGRRKNKAKTNPIKPNLIKAKMNVNSVKTKDYVNGPRLCHLAKQTQFKPNQSQLQTSQLLTHQAKPRVRNEKTHQNTHFLQVYPLFCRFLHLFDPFTTKQNGSFLTLPADYKKTTENKTSIARTPKKRYNNMVHVVY